MVKEILSVLWLIITIQLSALTEIGSPHITNYHPKKLFNEYQFWDIAQDLSGIMYFGASNGIITFDGTAWESITSFNHSTVRSLEIAENGTIYYGAVGDFGYLSANDQGKPVFQSLCNQINPTDRSFVDIWDIIPSSHGIYFISKEKIFHFNKGQVSLIKNNITSALNGYLINDLLFVYSQNGGLFVIKDGIALPLPYSQHLGDSDNNAVTCFSYSADKILLISAKKGLLLYHLAAVKLDFKKGLAETDLPLSEILNTIPSAIPAYLKDAIFYNAFEIDNQIVALATRRKGILLIDKQGQLRQTINTNHGLQHNCVFSLYLDQQKNVWAALNKGISCIELNSPLTYYGDLNGLDDMVLRTVRFENKLYAGSFSNGLLVLTPPSAANVFAAPKFQPIGDSPDYCFDLMIYKHVLIAVVRNALLQVTGNSYIKKTFSPNDRAIAGRALAVSGKFPDYIFVGYSRGLNVIKTSQNISSENPHGFFDFPFIHSFDKIQTEILRIHPDSQGNLWITTRSNGIYFFDFQNNSPLNPVISHFTKDEGLPDDSYNYVYNIKGTMYIASKKGIFKIIYPKTISADSSQFRFIEDSQLNSVFNGNPMEIMEINLDSTNNIWIHSNDFIGKIQFSQEKKLNWFTTPFQKIKSNIYRAYFEDSGIVWISTYDGLFQYNSNNCKNYYQDYMSLIRKVIINNHERYSGYSHLKTDSLNNPKSIEKTLSDVKSNAEIRKTPEFSSHENSIEFRFSTPFYEHADENQYSYFLAGNDQQWSQWSSDAKVTYTNLSLGTYCFQVKARNVFLQQSLPGMYHFIINPHWSKSLWAIISYIVLSLLVFTAVVFLILRLRTNTLKRNKEKLTQVVEQRTIDLKNSINELTLANEYKGELLNIMAHGLKNPLQIIRGHADLLEMKLKSNNFQDPAKLFKHINTMQSSSEQMLTLIQNTLSNAANSKKLQVMNLSLMNLSELAQFVSDAFRQIAINKQQELIINIKNNIFINGDKSRIREIIENLISNATKYTPLSGRIGFSVKPVNGFAEMSVQDNGPGISEEDKTNLFKEFHRLSSTPTGGESSTGLGLSIVKKLVELHQGIIQVESTLGKGSKFIVRIPLANEQINHLQLIADINTVAGQNNYESFQQHITNEWYRCLRNQKPLSLILMKIVPFKKIIKDHNIDRIYQCQIAINKIFSREINRAGDYFCQYKDELFLILLTETDQRGAQEAIESFETSFQQSNCIRDLQIDSETKGIQTVFTTIIPSLGKRVDDLINELLARMNKIKK